MSKTNTLKLYIPRMLGYVTVQDLKNTFHDMNIGKITYCDLHKKINEKKYSYSYVFFNVELYNTSQSKKFVVELNKQYIIKLVYDEEAGQYWEVKKHVNKDLRPKMVVNLANIPVFYLEAKDEKKDEKKEIVVDIETNSIDKKMVVDETSCNDDYDTIMNQIYNENTRDYYYNLWENQYDLWSKNTISL